MFKNSYTLKQGVEQPYYAEGKDSFSKNEVSISVFGQSTVISAKYKLKFMSCCDHQLFNDFFDAKNAQLSLDEYLSTGPKKSSLPLIESLKSLSLKGLSLLDIGGGIGAVTFELFKNGISNATHIEIAKGYAEVFRQEVKRRGLDGQVVSLIDNFPDIHDQVQEADLVILDKVICCYHDYKSLVGTSAAKARKYYVYSIPREVWWVKLKFWVDEVIDKMRGRYIPVYYHPVEGIESILENQNFKRKEVKLIDEWRIVVFEKE